MANVTHEQKAGDTLHVTTLEEAEEIERTLKEQSFLKDDPDNSSDGLTAATKDSALRWTANEATVVRLSHAFRELGNRRTVHDELYVAAKKALQCTLEVKRKTTEIQEDVGVIRKNMSGLKATSMTGMAPDSQSNETMNLKEATEVRL